MPKITLGITELHEVLCWDYGIEEPFLGPSENALKIGSTLQPVPRQKQKKSPFRGGQKNNAKTQYSSSYAVADT